MLLQQHGAQTGIQICSRNSACHCFSYRRFPPVYNLSEAAVICILKMRPSSSSLLTTHAKLLKKGLLPGSATTKKKEHLWRLFVHRLVVLQCGQGLTDGNCLLHVCLAAALFGHVRLPQKELVEERVDRVWTLHHDHVTSFLYDFEECKQKDLEKGQEKEKQHVFRLKKQTKLKLD